MQLVEKHNISEKSYGDAIKQIYKLLVDNRIQDVYHFPVIRNFKTAKYGRIDYSY